jgi:mttA/Hcf106 family
MPASPNESAVTAKEILDLSRGGHHVRWIVSTHAPVGHRRLGPFDLWSEKLPELGKELGDGIRGFKSAMNADPAAAPVKEAEAGSAA